MPVAPISEPATIGVSASKQQARQLASRRAVGNLAADKGQYPSWTRETCNALAILVFMLMLPACASLGRAQEAPQFDDLAARAAAARDQGNLPQAIDLYRQAEQLRPDWAEGWFYLGLLQYSANSFQPAVDAFNHFLALTPTAAPAMALRGLCEFETADYAASLRDLEEAVNKGAANEPHNEQIIRYHYAQMLAHVGRFQDALLQYQFFAQKKIDDPELLLGLGLAGMRIATLPKDIAADARIPFEAAGSAGYVFLSGDSQVADSLFQNLFVRYPTTPNLHFFYGVLLFMHGPDMAIDQFRDELTVAPNNAAAHAILAYSLMIAGRFAEARPEAELALAGAPDMSMAQLALGRSLAEAGDTEHATELLNKVLQRSPDDLEAHMALVALYSRTGRREDEYRERQVCLGLAK
jgi:tetratricopeptide (TPR) repeat protein